MFRPSITLVIHRRAISALSNRYPAQVGQRSTTEAEVVADPNAPEEKVNRALHEEPRVKVEEGAKDHRVSQASLDPDVAASRPVVTGVVRPGNVEEPPGISKQEVKSDRVHHHKPHHEHKHVPATHADVAKSSPSKQKPQVRPGSKPLARTDPGSRLHSQAKERAVPSSRLGRLWSYGGLAAGLGVGALAEVTRRSLGFAEGKKMAGVLGSSAFLTEANVERIVDTLCKVRGAALKIGQMLSMQDQSLFDPQLVKIFERVRQSADFMPTYQMENMLVQQFGTDWRDKFATFEEKPFAAASIGQVHLGTLQDGRKVAVKIQYPGVAEGIESDINNLLSILQMGNFFPKGLYLEEFIKVARMELGWEVDYIREAECARKYRNFLLPYEDYYVPEVIDDLSAERIYTTELIEGITLDKCEELDQATRDRIGYLVVRLFILELFGFQFMQTDPNWANFLYNEETKQLGLLDFGACRDYSDNFVGTYIRIIRAAVDKDRERVLHYSREIGFLTGYEKKAMEEAHVNSVMILGEAFKEGGGLYDFGHQDISPRVQTMISVMLEHRLCPPPEEVYSLHRKLSGVFLLCTKLRSRVDCTSIFEEAWNDYLTKKPGFDEYLHGQL